MKAKINKGFAAFLLVWAIATLLFLTSLYEVSENNKKTLERKEHCKSLNGKFIENDISGVCIKKESIIELNEESYEK